MGDRRRQPGGQKDVNWLWFLIGLNAGLALSLFLVVTALALGICLWTQTDSQPGASGEAGTVTRPAGSEEPTT
jgi:hypothetical protein